jgi:hypothetical protein
MKEGAAALVSVGQIYQISETYARILGILNTSPNVVVKSVVKIVN